MNLKIKKILKRTFLVCTAVILMFLLIISIYYLFFFKNGKELAYFVPADSELYISIEDITQSVSLLQSLYTPENIEKLLSQNSVDSKAVLKQLEKLDWFFSGETAVVIREGKVGFAARISFPIKLGLLLPGILSSYGILNEEILGNTVYKTASGNETLYFSHKWDIICGSTDRNLAGDLVELLNKRPVIKPMAHNPSFLGFTQDEDSPNKVFMKNVFPLPESQLTKELKKAEYIGGGFTCGETGLEASLKISGSFQAYSPPLFPVNPKALAVVSFPFDLKTFWLDYCYRIQDMKHKANSLQVSLTSDIFDPLFDLFEQRAFAYMFKKPGQSNSMYPSTVLCFRGNTPFSEQTLDKLWHSFAQKARDLNSERIEKSGAQPLEIENEKKTTGGVTVYFMTIKPSFIPGLEPGFCIVDNVLLVGTDPDYLFHTALTIRSDSKEKINNRYYLNAGDPGMKTLLGSIKKFFSSPSRIKSMGVKNHARFLEFMDIAAILAEPIESIRVTDSGDEVLTGLSLSVKTKPLSVETPN